MYERQNSTAIPNTVVQYAKKVSPQPDTVNELVFQAQNGKAFGPKGSTPLRFANDINPQESDEMKWFTLDNKANGEK